LTSSLVVFGALGLASTAFAVVVNKHLFASGSAGRPTVLEWTFYVAGVTSLCLGWYFNVRYTHAYHNASYVNYTRMLFTNWASDSAAQDYTIVNIVLLPLWTIVDGRRRNLRAPWIFFVMSLFTSLAFAMAAYLAVVERQVRYARTRPVSSSTA
jgi:hypothetical protein